MSSLFRRSGLVLTFGALAAIALPALATPPAHAPAHGWRKKNDAHYVGYQGRRWDDDYGIVGGRCNREEVGAVLGAVVGGAIGSQVGSGDGRTIAIIAGALIGAAIGAGIGEDMDREDRACIGHALELGRDGTPVRWSNPERRVDWQLTPLATQKRDGRDCRQYRLVEQRDGRKRSSDGLACRYGDGEWRFVKY